MWLSLKVQGKRQIQTNKDLTVYINPGNTGNYPIVEPDVPSRASGSRAGIIQACRNRQIAQAGGNEAGHQSSMCRVE
jgi:hypothetical protein